MKTSNANKVISVLMSVAMCPMMVPSAAFAADDDMASGGGSSSSTELTQSSGQAEGADTGASSGTTSATQPEAAGTTTTSNENAASAATAGEAGAAAAAGEENSGSATGEETATGVAEVNGTSYPSLQAAIDAASRKATVKLLADTKENVTISTPYVTLDLNGYTLNGSTGERKPALTVTNRVYVMDSSEAQTGTIMREDTAENSGVSSHYVIDVQGGNSGWLFFQSGNVKNDSGAGGTNGASLVRVGDDSKPGVPGLTISGGTFTQDNFIVLKCDYGNLYVKGGTIKYDSSTLTLDGVEATTSATSGIETNGNNANDTVVLKNSTLNVPNGFGIYFPSSGTLTIDNSTINAKTMGVQVCSGSLNVNAGSTIAVTGDPVVKTEPDGAIQDGAAISVVNRPGYKGLGKIAITGGTFTAKAGNAAIKAYTWDSSTKQESAFDNSAKTVTVSGGTFSSAVSSDLCAEGFAPVKNEDGTYGIATAVAQIGETAYASVQDAIDAAQADDAVKLLKDATENITVDASKQITLDLNGYTLNGGTGSAKATILNKGNVTITDTSAGKTGTIKRDDQGVEGETSYYVIRNIGTMVIDQANVVNNSGYKKTNPSGSMVGSSLICNGDDDPQASLTINGGAFTQPNFLVVKNGTNGMLAVNGGTLTSNHSAVQNWNKAQILGGSLKGQIWTDAYVEGMIGETVIGGDAQFEGEIVVDITGSVPPTVKIEGGKLDIASWKVTAAAAKADATIAVSGGTFMAAVPEAYCAAGYTPADNGDGTFGVKLPDGAYALQDYRSGDPASWTYPTQEDKAFAGWYKDPAFKTPYTASDVEGAAYAKFVDITALLQFKGGSLRMDKGEAAVSTDLRFGYTKAIPEGATYISNGWYIKSLKEGSAKDDSVEASNNVLNNDGTVTSNLVLIDVPKNCYKLDFAEKAFVKYVTVDGTAVEAIESQYQSRSVSAVADAILRHPMASQHEKQYANEIKSAIQ